MKLPLHARARARALSRRLRAFFLHTGLLRERVSPLAGETKTVTHVADNETRAMDSESVYSHSVLHTGQS
ncbi:MAG: hypothetical protein WBE14_23710, partial [Xanthobacteraceae bacterium]